MTDDIDGQRETMHGKRGNRTSNANVSTHDPRVTTWLAWGMAVFGGSVLAIGGWIGNSFMGVKDSVTTLVAQNGELIRRLDRSDNIDDLQDARLSKNERDIAVMEGKVLRGIQEGRVNGQ